MLIPVLLFIVGLLCLIKGGDWFVDGATGIARRFHVPELLIGATVVSIGTTLPEVMVSTTSALTGHGEIAYGNAIGSVICNSALIAAITIAVRPGKVDPKSLRPPVAFFFVAAAFYAGVAYTTGSFTRPVGLILLAMFVAYIVCNVLAMKNTPAPEEEEQAEEVRGTTGASFTVERDISTGGWNGNYSTQEFMSEDMIQQIAAVDGIEGYDATLITLPDIFNDKGEELAHENYSFYNYGSYNSQYHELFLSGRFELVEGTHITDDMQRAAAENIDRGIGKATPQEDASEPGQETAPAQAEKPSMTDFKPYVGRKRRSGTGCVSEINDHLFEGRYSPKWPDGKKHARNVYAHTREECEEKLRVLIVEMKAEIVEAQRLMDLGEGDGSPLEEKSN